MSSLLNDAANQEVLKSMQDSKGDWYINDPKQKRIFKTHAENYILQHSRQADPRQGIGKVFMYNKDTKAFDEKLIRNYQKFITGEKPGIMFNDKQKDLIKKANRRFRESPDTKAILKYAKDNNHNPAQVEAYLKARASQFIAKDLDIKQLSRQSLSIGGEAIEVGHEISLTTAIDRILKEGNEGRPVTSAPSTFAEPKSENRGLGQRKGSTKTINLDAAAGTVPRHWVEDYRQWLDSETAKAANQMNPWSTMGQEYNLQEQEKIRNIPENAPKTAVDDVKTEIYDERKQLQKQHGIELHSNTNKKLDAEGLYRNIVKAAGQSNNPLVNVSGDIVGAVMDGVAFAANPKDKDALADLMLSGSQALLSLASIGLTAVPIPGARPGAYMLMKIGDNVGKVERIWNLSSKIELTGKVSKKNLTKQLIQQDFDNKALTGKLR